MVEKIYVNWNDFEIMMEDLTTQIIKEQIQFDSIYGLPRGGLIPAIILSHIFDVKLIENKENIKKKTLIVDDISDTGSTLIKLNKVYNPVVTVYSTPWTRYKPICYVADKLDPESWITFPWEYKIKEGDENMERQTTLDEFNKEE